MTAHSSTTSDRRAPRSPRTQGPLAFALLSLAACLMATDCQPLEQADLDGSAGNMAETGGHSSAAGGTGAGSSDGRGTGGAGPSSETGGGSTVKTGGTGGGSAAPATGGSATRTGGSFNANTGGSTGSGGKTSTGGSSPQTGGNGPATGGSAPGTGGAMSGTGGATCTGQTHLCVGSCVSSSSVATCGASCDPCPVPAGGTATCDGTRCDFNCGAMKRCGSKCVPSDGCCGDGDCPAQGGTARQCDTSTNTCKASGCASGFKPCNNTCIDNKACCSSNDCTGTCQTCSGPGGSCVAVKNADDTDSCAGTCDGSGACKSKRGQTCNTVSGGCIGGSTCAPDGYCCDTACTGSCQACDIKGMQGTCTPVASGAPHGNRQACASDGSSCGGKCSGKSDGTCDYPAGTCGDAMCSGTNMSVGPGTCSAGTCQKPAPKTCPSSLICSGAACKTSCSAKSDCVGDLVCNGGSCGAPVQSSTTSIDVDTVMSGRVESNGTVDARVAVGDYADDSDSCGFVSFPLSTIPKGATVTKATLTIYQQSVTGTPYDDLGGPLIAQDVSYTSLSKSAYSAGSSSNVAISTNNTTGTKSATVTSMVASDVSKGAANTQFRFCFALRTDGGADQDFVLIPTGGSNKPTLAVSYDH